MRLCAFALLLFSLSGCSIWAPGEDPKGRDITADANNLLSAINSFHSENQRLPKSLAELYPKYLSNPPSNSEILYLPEKGSIFTTYSPTWPQAGKIACGGEAGQQRVTCNGYW